ncbi:MAG: hypothetical protein F7B60_04315 [Desulfurococcales archaeon]|nr:hypothetical protein [Desulfurococcales archaeon]
MSADEITATEEQEEEVTGTEERAEEEDIGFIVLSSTLVESMLTYIDILESLARGEITVTKAKTYITEIKPPEVKKKRSKTKKKAIVKKKTKSTKTAKPKTVKKARTKKKTKRKASK